jgi:16S rRNA (cytosine1402-N4)-methyltransferase
MRFDRSQDLTAAELVNETDERELETILRDYGDERRASAIARRIVSRRPLRTTTDLRRAVVSVLGPFKGGIDPATRTFQAIRIAVNREPSLRLSSKAPVVFASRAAVVVSYHSLEDRAVTRFSRESKTQGTKRSLRILTKSPHRGP